MIKKVPTGWKVDIQPNGRGGFRYRKILKTKAEALRWEVILQPFDGHLPSLSGHSSFKVTR